VKVAAATSLEIFRPSANSNSAQNQRRSHRPQLPLDLLRELAGGEGDG
jgi:hypothetical protein